MLDTNMPLGMELLASGSLRFSLDGVAANDRSAVYREIFGRSVLNYDLEPLPDTPFGVDLKFQCWALVVEYINRSPEFAGKTADNEFRFTLNLLGVGGVLSTRLGASESGAHLK